MDEQVILQEGGALVTKARVVLGGTTYAVRNVSAVSMATAPSQTATGIVAIVLGMACGVGAALSEMPALYAICAIMIILGSIAMLKKPDSIVSLQTNSGKVDGLVTKDDAFAGRVKAAIETAIVNA